MAVASVTAETDRPLVEEPSGDVADAGDGPLVEVEGSPAGGATDATSGEGPLLEGLTGTDADSDAPDVERAAAAVAAAMSGLRPLPASWARGVQPAD